MSSQTYNELLLSSVAELRAILDLEVPENPESIPSLESEEHLIYEYYAQLYARYALVHNKLCGCHDQMVHPQKRTLVQKLLEATMGRLLEVKAFLVSLQCSDFPPIDDILLDRQINPNDFHLEIPSYFVNNRLKELSEREKLLDALTAQYQITSGLESGDNEPTYTKEQAIKMIQSFERGRQALLRTRFMKEIRGQEGKDRKSGSRAVPLDSNVAAVRIQRLFRGYSARCLVAQEREEELIMLGMALRPKDPSKNTNAKEESSKARRRLVQSQHETSYEDAQVTIRDKIIEIEVPEMRESMEDEIRQWFIDHRDRYGKFPDYPSVAQGGSATIFVQQDESEEEEEEEAPSRTTMKKPATAGRPNPKDDEPKITIPLSRYLDVVQEGVNTYIGVWQGRDESTNPTQHHDSELIREAIRPVVEEEARLEVDELMRQELSNLKLAVEKGGRKKKAARKPRAARKKKGRKEKDMTSERTIESLYAEFVSHGILHKMPITKMSEYVACNTVLSGLLEDAGVAPDPSSFDVKRVITESCIFPLGCEQVREKGPSAKGVLLYGFPGSGKSLLARAVATETGSLFVDLSPYVTNGKYSAHTSLMVHMAFKLAKALNPAVIYIGQAEKALATKVKTPEGEDKPNRIKKDLLKEMKLIKPSHRVLVLGISDRPMDGDLKTMTKVFSKQFFVPLPDYAHRRLLWQTMISRAGGVMPTTFDLSSLTLISDGYSSGAICNTVSTVLSPRRKLKMASSPLMAGEFVTCLSKERPIFLEADVEMRKFMAKLPLAKSLKKREAEAAAALDGKRPSKPKPKKP